MTGIGRHEKTPGRVEERIGTYRPAFLASIIVHGLLGLWIVVEIGLLSGGAEPGPKQARIDHELAAPLNETPTRVADPPVEEPSSDPDPDAPEPRIDDDLLLPAPWYRPVESSRGPAREDVKRPSEVVARSRPPSRPTQPPAESRTEVREPAAEALPEVRESERVGATKIQGSCPRPSYPRRAQTRKQEGRVTLLTNVGRDGSVLDVQILTSSGHDLLDRAAIDAVRRWRFKPALEDGRAVRDRLRIPITFQLPRR